MEKTKKEKKPLMTKNEKEFVCTLFALIIIAIFFIATPPSGLSADGMKVLGVFISVLFLWITVGIGWPSLFSRLKCSSQLVAVRSAGRGKRSTPRSRMRRKVIERAISGGAPPFLFNPNNSRVVVGLLAAGIVCCKTERVMVSYIMILFNIKI